MCAVCPREGASRQSVTVCVCVFVCVGVCMFVCCFCLIFHHLCDASGTRHNLNKLIK